MGVMEKGCHLDGALAFEWNFGGNSSAFIVPGALWYFFLCVIGFKEIVSQGRNAQMSTCTAKPTRMGPNRSIPTVLEGVGIRVGTRVHVTGWRIIVFFIPRAI